MYTNTMPSPYVIRDFQEGNVYHTYNCGTAGRGIFGEKQDYEEFLKYLYVYVRPLDAVQDTYPDTPVRLFDRNLSTEIDVLAYCFMPTHYHLLLRQHSKDGTPRLMKQLTNAYTSFFNKKYNHVGSLFQGRYKAVQIDMDKYLMPISRYIHLNPVFAGLASSPHQYPWSSFGYYADGNLETVCKKRVLLSFFTSSKQFISYTEDTSAGKKDASRMKRLLLENSNVSEAIKGSTPDMTLNI